MACCVITAYVMNRIIRACEILNLDMINIKYNDFDDGQSFDDDAKSSHEPLVVSKFVIEGMTCSACPAAIETAIKHLNGIEAVSVSLPFSRASIAHYKSLISTTDIVAAIEKSGYAARCGLRTAQQNFDLTRHNEDLAKQKTSFSNAVALSSSLTIIDWIRVRVLYISPLCITLGLVRILLALWCQVVEAEWVHRRAWQKGGLLSPNMDTLISLSLILGLLLSILQTFLYGLDADATYWSSGSMLTVVIIGGRYIDTLLRRHAKQSIAHLYDLQRQAASVQLYQPPQIRQAHMTVKSRPLKPSIRVPAIALRPGDEICINPGMIIPCDCYVTVGASTVDQASMTGESLPVNKEVGDFLMSGTRNLASNLVAVVSKPQDESALEQLVSNVVAATETPSDYVAADFINGRLVHFLIVISICCASYSFLSANNSLPPSTKFIYAGERAMAILASACPCALGLAAPSAIMSAISAALGKGVLIRSGFHALEKLASVSHVVMDKTGTLTTGQLSVAAVTGSIDHFTCMMICAAERVDAASHPVAKTIFRWALQELHEEQRHTQHQLKVIDSHSEPGKGVSCTVRPSPNAPSNIEVHIGTAAFLAENNISIPISNLPMPSTQECGITVHVALAKKHKAIFHLLDTIRPSASLITHALQANLGLSLTMLTGDSASEAARVSAQLGNVLVLSSRALPHEKGEFIATIRASPLCRGVAMVGDGLNDAPALAAADVGILLAPTGGPALSSQVADVVLATADLGRLLETVVIARQTLAQVHWNRAWAVVYNVLAIGVAAGILEPWGLHVDARGAGLAMVGSSASVVVWSLWFRRRLGAVDWRVMVKTETDEQVGKKSMYLYPSREQEQEHKELC
ncbi:hypothetical protein H2204_000386 [Knufia peltigerae]|uniref:HMA domain-containing protein n=1 Tax=Knufia peltigerae TaxID=1002370 RepID=A0AA39D4R5_9EURO|nr:hypothetical protein H2204_000386 [Knufia peltigerae]